MENLNSDPLKTKNDDQRNEIRSRWNFFAFICQPFRRLLNYLRQIFTSTESTDGRNQNSRSWRDIARRLREIFTRNRSSRQVSLTSEKKIPRLVLPKINIEHEYNMTHTRRGLAIIFNHKYFDVHTGYNTRNGTEVDLEKLVKTFRMLKFKVKFHHDLTRTEIFEELEKISKRDHSQNDCVLITILSHGEKGQIFSRDDAYDIEHVTSYFTDQACPTLKNKPKLFFIQSCRGKNFDRGHGMEYSLNYRLQRQDMRGGLERVDVTAFREIPGQAFVIDEMVHNPPNHPDFLIVRSTMVDYVSFRNTTTGSWFIQELCEGLDNFGTNVDILTLLTYVNRRVSERVTNDGQNLKQILCISTMLTKRLIFHKKTCDIT